MSFPSALNSIDDAIRYVEYSTRGEHYIGVLKTVADTVKCCGDSFRDIYGVGASQSWSTPFIDTRTSTDDSIDFILKMSLQQLQEV